MTTATATKINKADIIRRATEFGRTAFERGIKSAPALDARVLPLVGECLNDSKLVVKVLTAWSRAWHAANIAAPVVPVAPTGRTREQVERLVRSQFTVYKPGQGQEFDDLNQLAYWVIDKTTDRIMATGECVWHASSVVLDRVATCPCTDCVNTRKGQR